MNKKGSLTEIAGTSVVFSLTSIIYIFLAVLNYGIINDYIIFNMQNVTETLYNDGIIPNRTVNFMQARADEFRLFNFHFDDLWFLSYFVFVFSSLTLAYRTRQMNYFGFLNTLFYGVMFMLFVLSIFTTLTTWFNDNILLKILPGVIILLPKFYFYLEHIGLFTLVHFVLCMLINMVDLDFASIVRKKKKEDEVMDDEVV